MTTKTATNTIQHDPRVVWWPGEKVTPGGARVEYDARGPMGINGAFANIAHHAEPIEGVFRFMVSGLRLLPLSTITPGHQQVRVKTPTNRRFSIFGLRPGDGRRYVGLELVEITKHGLVTVQQVIDYNTARRALDAIEAACVPILPNMNTDARKA